MVRRPIVPATRLIEKPVTNAAGEDLGKLEELMVDLEHGRIAYAVLSFGGILGLGSKLFAIPWEALDRQGGKLRLDVDRKTLESAPGFDHNQWPDVTDRAWGRGVYKHFGHEPYW